MSEFKFHEAVKAQMVLDLIDLVEAEGDQNNPLHHYIQAVKDFNSVDEALAFLSKECPICYCHYSIHEVYTQSFMQGFFFGVERGESGVGGGGGGGGVLSVKVGYFFVCLERSLA